MMLVTRAIDSESNFRPNLTNLLVGGPTGERPARRLLLQVSRHWATQWQPQWPTGMCLQLRVRRISVRPTRLNLKWKVPTVCSGLVLSLRARDTAPAGPATGGTGTFNALLNLKVRDSDGRTRPLDSGMLELLTDRDDHEYCTLPVAAVPRHRDTHWRILVSTIVPVPVAASNGPVT
jgi:hypothetical protein